jgi:hypothetical protein
MIKPQLKIVIPEEVQKRLHALGEHYGMSGNAIAAAAAVEISRIRPEDLWHALGRIAGEGAAALPPITQDALPDAKKRLKQAIPA